MRLSFALAAALVAAAAGCQGKNIGGANEQVPAPVFVGKNLDGEYVHLQEDFKGKVVLLNVWATWCKPCRKELPELQALHAEHHGESFSVVGISVDKAQQIFQLKRMVKEYGLTYPIVLDPDGGSMGPYKLRGYPTNFLLGKTGQIVWRRDGIIRPGDEELAPRITAAIAAPG